MKGAISMMILSMLILVSLSSLSLGSSPGVAQPVIHGISSGNMTSTELYLGNNYANASSVVMSEFTGLNVTVRNYGYIDGITYPASMSGEVARRVSFLSHFLPITSFSQKTPYSPMVVTDSSSNALNPYTPSQLASYYGFKWDFSHGINGRGLTVAVVDAYGDPAINYDLAVFDNFTGLPSFNLTIEQVGSGTFNSNSSWALETALDVEWVHAMAPMARIILYVSSDASGGLDKALSLAVTQGIANVISVSWGSAESLLSQQEVSSMNSIISSATSSGITIVAASGDQGSNDGTSSPTVNFPASDPNVLSVGGVSLFNGSSGFSESAWGGVNKGVTFGSGGGYSKFFNAPYWQSGIVQGTHRGVPDVAMIANPQTPVVVFMKGNRYNVGGTSLGTPIWGDIIALMDQYNGMRLGNTDPLLYQIYRSTEYSSAFSDITTGTNGKYAAGTGWDPVTGLGTPHVSALVNLSRLVIQGYSSTVLFNGSNDTFSTVSGNITIHYNDAMAGAVGGFYYYLQFFASKYSWVRGGLLLSNGSEILELEADTMRGIVAFKQQIGVVSPGTFTSQITLTINQTYLLVTDGNHREKASLFLPYLGSMFPGAGASAYLPFSDIASPYYANISGIRLAGKSGTVEPAYAYENHWSGFPDPAFNHINIIYVSRGNLSVVPSYNLTYGDIGGGHPNTTIVYTLFLASPLLAIFSLTGSTRATWNVDGTAINGVAYYFRKGGNYNVTATYGTPSVKVSRIVYVPVVKNASISVTSYPSYYRPMATLHYDLYSSFNFTLGNSTVVKVPVYLGDMPIGLNANGYVPISTTINGSMSLNYALSMVPEPVNLRFYVYPDNATIRVGPQSRTINSGYAYFNITPDIYTVTVSHPGFRNLSFSITLFPGKNASYTEVLSPTFRSYLVSGTVRDKGYGIPIPSVKVTSPDAYGSYSSANGTYYIYLTPGSHNLTFTKMGYNSTSVELSVNSNMTLNIRMQAVFLATSYSIKFGFSYPFLFAFLYVSWSYSGPTPSYFVIYYSSNSSMDNANSVSVSASSSYKFITMSDPFSVHYMQIMIYYPNGVIGWSSVVSINPVSVYSILGNAGMFILIVTYIFFTVSFLRKRRRTIQ